MKPLAKLLSAAILVATATAPAWAHHSHAMFDHTKEVTIKGMVKAYNFYNPHVYLFVDVAGEAGAVQTWSIEMSHIQNMLRRGITGQTFKVGDMIEVTVNPLRDGRHGGNYFKVVTADGTVFE